MTARSAPPQWVRLTNGLCPAKPNNEEAPERPGSAAHGMPEYQERHGSEDPTMVAPPTTVARSLMVRPQKRRALCMTRTSARDAGPTPEPRADHWLRHLGASPQGCGACPFKLSPHSTSGTLLPVRHNVLVTGDQGEDAANETAHECRTPLAREAGRRRRDVGARRPARALSPPLGRFATSRATTAATRLQGRMTPTF